MGVCLAAVPVWLRKEALLKKRSVLSILLYAVALIVCAQPLPLDAQSGSSTCQVTATAGETEAPPPGDTGNEEEEPKEPGTTAGPEARPTEEPGAGPTEEPGTGRPEESGEPGAEDAGPEEEGEEPEPGETGTTPEPEGGETEEGNPEKETPEPEGTPIPGEETAQPDIGGDTPGEEPEPAQTVEPVPGEQPEEHDGYVGFILWLLLLGIFAALLAGGAFRWLWLLLRFLIFRRSRIRFHGILTNEKSFFIRVRNAEEGSGLVQDMIDSAGSFAEFREEIQKETAVTCIPGQSRMRISCTGRNGRKRAREMAAGERRMFRVLEGLEGTGDVEVRITCWGTGIDILLVFRV